MNLAIKKLPERPKTVLLSENGQFLAEKSCLLASSKIPPVLAVGGEGVF